MARIRYTIEPSWTISQCSDVIEIDDAEMEGMSEDERADHIGNVVAAVVADQCPWGWNEEE